MAGFAQQHPMLTKLIMGVTVALIGGKITAIALGYAWTFIQGGALALATAWRGLLITITLNDTISLIDLMVCYVEYGIDFLCEFGDMYEQYYCSLESVFSNALKLMKTFEYQ